MSSAGSRKVLVVVTVDVDASDLGELPDLAGDEVRVVAPLAQLSHAQWLTNDDRQEREAAKTRAHRVAGTVTPQAEGTVGDDDVLLLLLAIVGGIAVSKFLFLVLIVVVVVAFLAAAGGRTAN